MSKFEELMLAKWQEINRVKPPAEHLQSTLRAKPSRIRIVHGGNNAPENTTRNQRILRYYGVGYTPADIARTMHIKKNVVTGVLNRNRNGNVSLPLLENVDKKDILFSINPDDVEFPFIVLYKGKRVALRDRHYIIFKALLNHKDEWYPTKDLLDVYYLNQKKPKTAQNCFRKQVRLMRHSIEGVGLTTIIKPRYGYKLVKF
jgi:hypothetical protein